MAETDWHRKLMNNVIETLEDHFAAEPRVYVTGNLLLFYEKGNKRRHVSPDVFVVKGPEKKLRLNYLLWEEGQPPHVAIELTSSSTRREDLGKKFELYRDTLKVREYYMFDPFGDYLKPPMQGYRLRGKEYLPIKAVEGRLPSQVLGLHLERDGKTLRLWNPGTKAWLPTPSEVVQEATKAAEVATKAVEEATKAVGEAARAAQEAKKLAQEATNRATSAEEENERLRKEIAALKAKT